MDADGSNQTRVTRGEKIDERPGWSPDATTIAFNRVTKSGRLGVWIMNVDGTGATQQTFRLQDLFPDWGPS